MHVTCKLAAPFILDLVSSKPAHIIAWSPLNNLQTQGRNLPPEIQTLTDHVLIGCVSLHPAVQISLNLAEAEVRREHSVGTYISNLTNTWSSSSQCLFFQNTCEFSARVLASCFGVSYLQLAILVSRYSAVFIMHCRPQFSILNPRCALSNRVRIHHINIIVYMVTQSVQLSTGPSCCATQVSGLLVQIFITGTAMRCRTTVANPKDLNTSATFF